MPAPERPLLLPHVFARRHVTPDRTLVVLHDTERLDVHRVGERAWVALRAMDGTRDAAGIASACAKVGVHTTPVEVTSFIEELAAMGLVGDAAAASETDDDGPTPAAQRPASGADATDGERPLEHMPGFLLSCDGSGSCCRFYPTIAFSPLDAARARAHLPVVRDAGMDERAGFTPLRGSDPRMLAVALVDGRCAYLSDDDRCGIHARAGEAEKPLGCRTYPARFVDDGVTVRISPWIECACVLASAEARRGSALVDPALRVRRDLDSAIFVEPLPAVVHVGREHDATPGDVARWSLALRDVRAADGCASLLALARALDANGLDVDASRRALESPEPPDEDRLRVFLEAMLPRARRFADVGWRSERDLARTTAAAIAAATELALASLSDLVAPSPRFAADEAFYVRALVFGHQLCHPRRTMAVVATDRAARVVLARSLAVVAALTEQRDAAFSRPLALVEATMRAYGLSAYVPDAEAALASAEPT